MIGYKIGFLYGHELHYNQKLYGGELQAWMKNDMGANIATFLARGVLWRSSFWGNLKPSCKKLGLRKTPTWGFYFHYIVLHLVRHTNQRLK